MVDILMGADLNLAAKEKPASQPEWPDTLTAIIVELARTLTLASLRSEGLLLTEFSLLVFLIRRICCNTTATKGKYQKKVH